MEAGDRRICQEDDWHNAWGDSDVSVHRGMRLRVLEVRYVAGTRFFSFEETPKNNFYMALGFKPLRAYN